MKTLIIVSHPHIHIEELLRRPFELTFEYIHADERPFFAYYGIEMNSTTEWIERSVPLYRQFLEEFAKQ